MLFVCFVYIPIYCESDDRSILMSMSNSGSYSSLCCLLAVLAVLAVVYRNRLAPFCWGLSSRKASLGGLEVTAAVSTDGATYGRLVVVRAGAMYGRRGTEGLDVVPAGAGRWFWKRYFEGDGAGVVSVGATYGLRIAGVGGSTGMAANFCLWGCELK